LRDSLCAALDFQLRYRALYSSFTFEFLSKSMRQLLNTLMKSNRAWRFITRFMLRKAGKHANVVYALKIAVKL